MKTSEHLTQGEIYSREEFRTLFNIKAAGLNNGIFHPNGHDSILLFVTEEKSADRTQYKDLLDGDTLLMDGQLSGNHDRMIINHDQEDFELLLFYRKRRDEYPNSGFRYEGKFEYYAHKGAKPSHFILRRTPSK